MGRKGGERLYLLLGIVPFGVMLAASYVKGAPSIATLYVLYAILHINTYRKMLQIREGKALNAILGMTARNIFLYGIISLIVISSSVWAEWIKH